MRGQNLEGTIDPGRILFAVSYPPVLTKYRHEQRAAVQNRRGNLRRAFDHLGRSRHCAARFGSGCRNSDWMGGTCQVLQDGKPRLKPDGTPATAWHQYRQRIITADSARVTTAPIIAASHLVYQSDFPVSTSPSTALGPDWTSLSSGGISVTAGSGAVEMRVVNDAAANPSGLATLDDLTVTSSDDIYSFRVRR